MADLDPNRGRYFGEDFWRQLVDEIRRLWNQVRADADRRARARRRPLGDRLVRDRFMQGAAERGLRVDFIPLQWYGGDFGPDSANQLRGYLQAVHDRYHKPVWLTEYGLIDFSQNPPRYPAEQEQTAFIKSSTELLEGLDFVERYAWFMLSTQTAPTGLYDGTTANASGLAYRDADPAR